MIGSSELIVILVLALLLFGPKKLPELARALGNATKEYHRAARDLEREADKINKEIMGFEKELNEIRTIAENMGIDPKGKSGSELLEEIRRKTKQQA
jgi:sec-independent protein translocase protein TatA